MKMIDAFLNNVNLKIEGLEKEVKASYKELIRLKRLLNDLSNKVNYICAILEQIEKLEKEVVSLQKGVDKLNKYSKEHSYDIGCISHHLEYVNKELERKQDKEL